MLLIWSGTTKYCIELCGGPFVWNSTMFGNAKLKLLLHSKIYNSWHLWSVVQVYCPKFRERPFDFYGGGGGQEDFAKKIFRLWFQGKKLSGPKGLQKKISPACLRKRFRTPLPVFALWNLLSKSKICISHSVNCFAHSKNYIIYMYFWNDLSHYKKEVFCSLKKVRTWMSKPPPPYGLMKWVPGGFKKNSTARRASEKTNSPAPKIGKKNSPADLSLPAPPPIKIKWLFP